MIIIRIAILSMIMGQWRMRTTDFTIIFVHITITQLNTIHLITIKVDQLDTKMAVMILIIPHRISISISDIYLYITDKK